MTSFVYIKLESGAFTMADTIYTIGYSGFNIDAFINTLKRYCVNVLVDVRSNPYSAHYPEYNKEHLERILRINGIFYRNYSKEFGAQQKELTFFSPEGFLDFEAFVKSDVFCEGINKLEKGMQQDYTFALMCAEKNPVNCHRSIMISRVFHEAGHTVIHLLPDNKTVTQHELEEFILNQYYPNRTQISIFESNDENTLISEAYHKKNAEIGFRIEKRVMV